MKNDDLPVDELAWLAELEQDADFEEYEARLDEQLKDLEAHVRAARFCGA